MSHRLIDLNDDLRRLRDDGYNVDIDSGHLIVRDVPYVTSAREIRRGVLVTSLDLNGDLTIRPSDHTIKFVGEYPCASDGVGDRRHQAQQRLVQDKRTRHRPAIFFKRQAAARVLRELLRKDKDIRRDPVRPRCGYR